VTQTSAKPIKLTQRSGPARCGVIEIADQRPHVLGRSSTCDIALDDPKASISRQHLEIAPLGVGWMVRDLGSRNGTELNGSKLEPQNPASIKHGDVLRMGAWSFRVVTRADSDSTMIQTLHDEDDKTSLIERVSAEPLANLASHRLAVLLECADKIHRADTIEEAANLALHAMVESTGYARAAYLIPDPEITDQYQPLSFKSLNELEDVSDVDFSNSLLEGASEGDVVRLSAQSKSQDYGQSIADLDIHSALCVPVSITSDEVIGYLYLDARGSEGRVQHDASSFGRAVSRLLGLSISNMNRQELEIQQLAMRFDLDAAASAQKLLLPPDSGTVEGVEYAMIMRPGRTVAGDLFGVEPMKDGRVCVFLGDVSGKGAGAAILMAATQSYLHALLEQNLEIGPLVSALNKHVSKHSAGQFITMWIGFFDPKNEKVEFLDCGHGHWLLVDPSNHAAQPSFKGGLVIGIDPDVDYQGETIPFPHGSRLVLFSDGVVEQNHGDSEDQYGLDQAARMLEQSHTYADDVKILFRDVQRFAESEDLRDDTTIASIGLSEPS